MNNSVDKELICSRTHYLNAYYGEKDFIKGLENEIFLYFENGSSKIVKDKKNFKYCNFTCQIQNYKKMDLRLIPTSKLLFDLFPLFKNHRVAIQRFGDIFHPLIASISIKISNYKFFDHFIVGLVCWVLLILGLGNSMHCALFIKGWYFQEKKNDFLLISKIVEKS